MGLLKAVEVMFWGGWDVIAFIIQHWKVMFLFLFQVEPVPVRKIENPYAVQRPHASMTALQRQGSFRGFEKLQETSSPFKRTLSLRINDLPSTLQRQNAVLDSPTQNGNGGKHGLLNCGFCFENMRHFRRHSNPCKALVLLSSDATKQPSVHL